MARADGRSRSSAVLIVNISKRDHSNGARLEHERKLTPCFGDRLDVGSDVASLEDLQKKLLRSLGN